MGHSMGGIVATALLQESEHISAIITMSTPHTLPPARFDHRIAKVYDRTKELLETSPTPILSLCGGATDMMIPSESCILPKSPGEDVFRRTVFTSGLEGAWTGVGHIEMVWCHQVRWRVARAMLELTTASSILERGKVLDVWLRDGHTAPLLNSLSTIGATERLEETYQFVDDGSRLFLTEPRSGDVHLMKIPDNAVFTLFVSRGAIPPVSPQNPNGLRVSVLSCDMEDENGGIACNRALKPDEHRLIPNPAYGKTFPVPKQGSDESEGVVLFQVAGSTISGRWVGIRVDEASGSGWILGDFDDAATIVVDTSLLGMCPFIPHLR